MSQTLLSCNFGRTTSPTMAPTTRSSVFSLGWSWDVFLSFRGEDTRFTFTDQLYSALCQQKHIRTFRDEEGLDRGEEIGSSLLKAIEESRMYIVVFSKTYAHSKWCLDELAKIMECKIQKGQTVVPVFYHVEPSDVRNQTGSFGEAFDKYQKVPEDKVMRWKAALRDAANLSGCHVKHGYESQAIQRIVQDILRRNLKLLHVGDKLIGMERRLKEMASLMPIDSNDVCMIGIYGIDGICKTTLAKVVLVVLDDVDSDEQLNCLFPNHNAFGLGSRIIVTSRDKYLLVRCQVDALYGVKELNCKEAIQLFSPRAFHMNSPQKDYCKGLPLALEVLGSFLFGKKKIEWKSVLQRLEKEPFLKIQHVLVRGFEVLGMLEREIFLDVACFFNREDLDFVQQILDACHSFAKLIMQELDDKSLISILDKKLLMHDLMQKADWEIVRRQNHNEPGKLSRLWDPEDVHHGTKTIEGIFLNMSVSNEIHLTSDALKKMTKLRLLRVYQNAENNSIVSNTIHLPQYFKFPSRKLRYLHWDGWTLESLPSNFDGEELVELSLKHSSIKQLWKEHKRLPKLEVINLGNSQHLLECPNLSSAPCVERLILDGCTSLLEFLTSLAAQNLTSFQRSKGLERFPEIMEVMECLQKLLLDGTSIKELPPSIVHLKGLHLRSLETLIVSGCSKLSKLPEELGRLQFLMKLQVDGTAITQPPLSLFLLRNLKELSFRGCKGSTSNSWISSLLFRLLHRENSDGIGLQLPYLSGLYSLKYLDLSGCNLTDRSITDNLGHLRFLEELNLSRNNLVTVPEEVNRLSHLRVLYVNQCKRLQEISKLPPSIKLLDAGDCISLESLSVLSPQSPQYLSSSSRLCPVTFKLPNCFALAQDNVATILEKLHQNFLPEIEYSIVLPGSTIPEWFQHPSIGSSVTIELPRNWHNEEFLGFALCCVFSLEEDEIIQGPGLICCNFEFKEGPYLSSSISWTHSGDRVVETDHIWLVYQPGVKLMIPKSSSLNKFRKITAYFSLSGASHVVKNLNHQTRYTSAKRSSNGSGYYCLEETQPKRLRGGENCEEGSHA
ncbi:hypothetical protein AAG906_021120 [Vitis piasezkii]